MSQESSTRKTIPSLYLEQWRLGELTDQRKCVLIEEFGEATIHDALRALDEEETTFQRPPLRVVIPELFPARQKPWVLRAGPWLAAAGVIVALLLNVERKATHEPIDEINFKGIRPPLAAYIKMQDKIATIQEGQKLKQGDVIQFTYDSAAYTYGAIVSLDGRGQLTWLFPDERSGGQLTPGRRASLDFSYKLDDAPHFERFFLFRAHNPLDRNILEKVVRKAGEHNPVVSGDPPLDSFTLTIRKK